jgi:hypothetical protein
MFLKKLMFQIKIKCQKETKIRYFIDSEKT